MVGPDQVQLHDFGHKDVNFTILGVTAPVTIMDRVRVIKAGLNYKI